MRLVVYLLSLGAVACATAAPPGPGEPAKPAVLLRPAAEPSPPPAPPHAGARCAAASRGAADNLSVVVEDDTGKLGAALRRPPEEAAFAWADALSTLPDRCAGARVEHTLPALRVVVVAPAECGGGAPVNELTLDFAPAPAGSAVRVQGALRVGRSPAKIDARVRPASDGRALCVVGRVGGAGGEPDRAPDRRQGQPPAPGESVRWLSVPLEVVGGLMGLVRSRR
jgi:hypothetical protein